MKVITHNQTDLDISSHIKLIKKIFKHIKSKHNMQLIFTTPEDIKVLNQQYRNIDQPTDVLSFINDEPYEKSLGDVFINLIQADIQAKQLGHTLDREIGFLAVHGFLHLMGYDHHTEADEKKMMTEQENILNKANLKRGH